MHLILRMALNLFIYMCFWLCLCWCAVQGCVVAKATPPRPGCHLYATPAPVDAMQAWGRLCVLCMLLAARCQATWWHRAVLARATFQPDTQETLSLSKLGCSMACGIRDWCQLWCLEGLNGCHLTDMTVSPGLIQQDSDVLTCYTSRPVNAALEVRILASSLNPWQPLEHTAKENLVKGYLSSLLCGYLAQRTGGWFLLDLGRQVRVKEVFLHGDLSLNIEVRLGQTEVTEDFSSYSLLGSYPGSSVPLAAASPVSARYVSIQSLDNIYFRLCFVEVVEA